MTTPRPRALLGALLLAAIGWIAASCDDDDHGCEPNQPCPCAGGDVCALDCRDTENCVPVCWSAGICDVLCGSGCQYDCTNISECRVSTGPGSTVRCGSVSTCTATVAAGSAVDCTDLSTCDVVCTGDCEVHCSRVSNCSVSCAGGAAPVDCPGERKVCGRGC